MVATRGAVEGIRAPAATFLVAGTRSKPAVWISADADTGRVPSSFSKRAHRCPASPIACIAGKQRNHCRATTGRSLQRVRIVDLTEIAVNSPSQKCICRTGGICGSGEADTGSWSGVMAAFSTNGGMSPARIFGAVMPAELGIHAFQYKDAVQC